MLINFSLLEDVQLIPDKIIDLFQILSFWKRFKNLRKFRFTLLLMRF